MKIRQTQDRLTVENSLAMSVTAGAILAIGGIVLVIWAIVIRLGVVAAIGAALLVIGALLVALARSTHVVLDKSGSSSISTKRLFSESKSQSFALADIAAVVLDTRKRRDTVKQADGSTGYQSSMISFLSLSTRAGRHIPIGNATRDMNAEGLLGALVNTIPLKNEAAEIAAFIGVPVQLTESIDPGRFAP